MALFRRIANLFSRSDVDREIEAELQAHIDLRIDDNIASGMSPQEARRDALLRFGNRTSTREQMASADVALGVGAFCSDLRYALRVLRKSPGFTIAAIASLALAIGANAVVFGVLNALILHPLNVPDAASIYSIDHRIDDMWESYPNYKDLRDRSQSFSGLVALALSDVAIDTGKDPSRLWGFEATGNYFDELQIQPFLGRFFHASDERGPNSAPYIVLSYSYWHSHFLGDHNVVGRVINVNRHPFTILGVTPQEFRGTFIFFSPNFYVPMVNHDQINGDNSLFNRSNRSIIQILGRLKPQVSRKQAVAGLDAIGQDLKKTYPKEDPNEVFSLGRSTVPGMLARPLRAFVTALMLLTVLILLAACANLGSLFAARASDRSREVALRLALGSSRSRVLRQLLTEALLISLGGGAVGLCASIALMQGLERWQPFSAVPIHVPVQPDANVYLVALLLAVLSGFLFGIVPVRQVLRTNPWEIVKAGPSGAATGRISLRDILVVCQVAICAVLVTASLVAVRGLIRSLHSNFGIEPNNVLLVETDLKMSGYGANDLFPMQRRMLDALQTIPGVEHVGLVSFPPLGRGGSWKSNVFHDETRDYVPANVALNSYMFVVSPDYLRAAGTTLLAGRMIEWQDTKNTPRVALVNREFAAKMFGSPSNAIGKYYKWADGSRVQVVGIVEGGKYLSITEDPQPALYVPYLQSEPLGEQWMLLRSPHDSQWLAATVRTRLHQLDAGLPLDIVPWNRELDFSLFPARMATLSLGVLGVIGAMLSITGVFGMAAYSVSRRLKEFGIRVALGAQRIEVLRAALGRAVKLLAIGSAAGVILGVLASRVLAFIVYQATPRDPLVLVGAVLAMALLGLLATWIPAQRALSVNPLALLREE